MRQVKYNSKQNKYFFVEGDYVFELEKAQVLTSEFTTFFHLVFEMFHVSWEVYVDGESKQVKAIALHDAPYKNVLEVISLYQTIYKVNIANSYQII